MIRFCGIFSLSPSQSHSKMWTRQRSNWATPLDFKQPTSAHPSVHFIHSHCFHFSQFHMRLINAPFKKKVDTVPASLKGTTLEVFLHAREKWQSPWGHAALQQSLDSWKGQSNVAYRCARGLTADAPSWLGPGLCAVCADGGGDWWSVLSSVQIKRL